MADNGNQEEDEKSGLLTVLTDFRRLEPILQRLPALRANFAKIAERIFGSPARTRSMAGAEATAKIGREVADARATVIQAAAEREAARVSDGTDPELALRALERMGENAVHAQRNLEQTMTMACERVATLAEEGDAAEDISEDWLDHWCRVTETKSEEEVQRLLASVLVGEAHRPGRFSPATLQILSLLTPWLADCLGRLSRLTISDPDGPTLVLLITGSSKQEPLKDYGVSYAEMLYLQSSGLIMDLQDTQLDARFSGLEMIMDYAGQKATFRKLDSEPFGMYPAVALSIADAELRDLIALSPVPEYTEALTSYLNSRGVGFDVEPW